MQHLSTAYRQGILC